MSLDSGLWIQGARKILVLSEKEFKDRHRGDMSKSRLMIAKQKGTLSQEEGGSVPRAPRPQAFVRVCRHGGGQSWKTGLLTSGDGLCPNSSYKVGGGGLGFAWSNWGCYFPWAPEVVGQGDPDVCHESFCECQQSGM
jgi:hypothetical protein